VGSGGTAFRVVGTERCGSKHLGASTASIPGGSHALRQGEVIRSVFESEGIRLVKGRAVAVGSKGGGHSLRCASTDGGEVEVEGDVLLLATGRIPVVGGMGLDRLGIQLTQRGGIEVDLKLRTSCKGVYAAGGILGRGSNIPAIPSMGNRR
jgi:pyruvate/2-oxoglutarate dehydrogenase complex dihydrolipoamide dehydrogenase (E3) component